MFPGVFRLLLGCEITTPTLASHTYPALVNSGYSVNGDKPKAKHLNHRSLDCEESLLTTTSLWHCVNNNMPHEDGDELV